MKISELLNIVRQLYKRFYYDEVTHDVYLKFGIAIKTLVDDQTISLDDSFNNNFIKSLIYDEMFSYT